MNDEHVLKGAFEGIKFVPGKHREFSVAPAVDPTVVHMLLNASHTRSNINGARHNKRVLPLLNKCIGDILLAS